METCLLISSPKIQPYSVCLDPNKLTTLWTIGRATSNDIILIDNYVSWCHATLSQLECGRFLITDGFYDPKKVTDGMQKSTNGITVNDVCVFSRILVNNDIIRLGKSSAKFIQDEKTPNPDDTW